MICTCFEGDLRTSDTSSPSPAKYNHSFIGDIRYSAQSLVQITQCSPIWLSVRAQQHRYDIGDGRHWEQS